jgi:hypothetical protein
MVRQNNNIHKKGKKYLWVKYVNGVSTDTKIVKKFFASPAVP